MKTDLKLDEFGQKVQAILEQFLYNVSEKIITDAVYIIDKKNANATGRMRNSLTYEILKEAGKIVAKIGGSANVPYTIFRHEGTRPHWVPLAPLMRWIVQKGLVLDSRNKSLTMNKVIGKVFAQTKSVKAEGKALYNQIRNLAWLISRKISKKGTKGLKFLTMALRMNESYIIQKFKTLKFS